MINRYTRVSRVTLLAPAALLALVTLAAGCGTTIVPPSGGQTAVTHPAPGTTASAAPVTGTPAPVPTTTSGPPLIPGQPACTGWPANAAHGTLPASFTPVAVLRCVNSYQMIPGEGQWQTATLQRAGDDLAALIAALRRPPVLRTPGMMCAAIAFVPPQIVLISDDGKMLEPLLPTGGCGQIQGQVLSALAALPWRTVSVRLVAQVQTQREVSSGCTPGFTDPFALRQSPRPSPGGPVYATAPASLRVCVYSSGTPGTAPFRGGTTVTGATVRSLLTGLSGPGHTGTCTLPHSAFAVIGGQGPGVPVVYVELGGCDRVYRYETGSGGLSRVSVGHASAQAVAIIAAVTAQAGGGEAG